MAADQRLDRVKAYLLAFEGKVASEPSHDMQHPVYPCFPGLRHQPFHTTERHPGVAALEAAGDKLRQDVQHILSEDYLAYQPGKAGFTEPARLPVTRASWNLFLLSYMGVRFRQHPFQQSTLALLDGLPDVCLDYPWGDALLSVQAPSSRVAAHCSVDNLRVRCHLGIRIPDSCGIRVGREFREWREGKCLLFEDSIEHEVWNRSEADRIVLIVDFWHPGLSSLEREVLTAGFRKAEVREIFYRQRISQSSANTSTLAFLDQAIREQDDSPLIRRYWA